MSGPDWMGDLLNLNTGPPSQKVGKRIADIRARYSGSLPIEIYDAAVNGLSRSDQVHFDSQLQELGYVITGYAKGPGGDSVPVAISVLKIGLPIELTEMKGTVASLPPPSSSASNPKSDARKTIILRVRDFRMSFTIKTKPDDEVWHFTTSADSWRNLAGRAGLALVRDGIVIELSVSTIN